MNSVRSSDQMTPKVTYRVSERTRARTWPLLPHPHQFCLCHAATGLIFSSTEKLRRDSMTHWIIPHSSPLRRSMLTSLYPEWVPTSLLLPEFGTWFLLHMGGNLSLSLSLLHTHTHTISTENDSKTESEKIRGRQKKLTFWHIYMFIQSRWEREREQKGDGERGRERKNLGDTYILEVESTVYPSSLRVIMGFLLTSPVSPR